MRDDFSKGTKETLAKRVGMRCSNPDCRVPTSGPDSVDGSINVGEAAHISAASPGGARYDSSLTAEQRQDIQNGIWLCRKCSKLVDADELTHPRAKLVEWKTISEHMAALEVYGYAAVRARPFAKLEEMIPLLVREMRADVKEHPLYREFILLEKGMTYNSHRSDYLIYYYDDHKDLDSEIQVMLNYAAIFDITYNNTKRYNFSEEFVEHLLRGSV